jgi:chemotaxis protein histidine kinase CheA
MEGKETELDKTIVEAIKEAYLMKNRMVNNETLSAVT